MFTNEQPSISTPNGRPLCGKPDMLLFVGIFSIVDRLAVYLRHLFGGTVFSTKRRGVKMEQDTLNPRD